MKIHVLLDPRAFHVMAFKGRSQAERVALSRAGHSSAEIELHDLVPQCTERKEAENPKGRGKAALLRCILPDGHSHGHEFGKPALS